MQEAVAKLRPQHERELREANAYKRETRADKGPQDDADTHNTNAKDAQNDADAE